MGGDRGGKRSVVIDLFLSQDTEAHCKPPNL